MRPRHDGGASASPPTFVGRCLSPLHRCTACLFSFGFCCSKVALKAIGPLLVTLALSLISFVLVVYFGWIYPTLTSPSHHHLSPHTANLITALGLYLLLMTLFHYLSTMFIAPGSPPPSQYWTPHRRALLANDPELHHKGADHRYCRACDCIKPMRAHHCSLCNRCILKMDHHCPWVNNCVGWRNYRHFNLFCLYLHLVALFFLFTGWDAVSAVLTGRIGDEDLQLVVASVCSVSAGIAAWIFLVWNAYLSLTNQSTIEFYANLMDGHVGDHPYNMGWRHNLSAIYGPGVLRNLLLPVHTDPQGDGCLFPMNKGRGFPMPQLLNDNAV